MITIPIWFFTVLLLVAIVAGLLVIIDVFIIVRDKIINFVEWRTNYKKYKEFWDDNPNLR